MKRSNTPLRIRLAQRIVHDAPRRLHHVWALLEAESQQHPVREETLPPTLTPASAADPLDYARANGGDA